jgi:hypothetical protein
MACYLRWPHTLLIPCATLVQVFDRHGILFTAYLRNKKAIEMITTIRVYHPSIFAPHQPQASMAFTNRTMAFRDPGSAVSSRLDGLFAWQMWRCAGDGTSPFDISRKHIASTKRARLEPLWRIHLVGAGSATLNPHHRSQVKIRIEEISGPIAACREIERGRWVTESVPGSKSRRFPHRLTVSHVCTGCLPKLEHVIHSSLSKKKHGSISEASKRRAMPLKPR